MTDASYGGKAYLFDFLRMVRIDEATGEETGLAWIDHRRGLLFPGARLRRGEEEAQEGDDAPAEDEVESSSGVDERERSGESPGVYAKRRKAWGDAAARLDDNDKYYQVVSKLFLIYGIQFSFDTSSLAISWISSQGR